MSLVLEALRRQQSEDDQGDSVTLALAAERQRRQRGWLILLSAALLLNAALFAWLFRDRLTDPAEPAPAAATTPGTQPALRDSAGPIANGVAGAAPRTLDAPDPPAGVVDAPPENVPAPGYSPQPPGGTAAQPQYGYPTQPWNGPSQPMEAPPPRVLERVSLDALPPVARARLPGIVISTHVYAEDPALRAIVVNGKRLQEGDQVAGLTIREINEFGIVIEFESYLVDVPVFTDWAE